MDSQGRTLKDVKDLDG